MSLTEFGYTVLKGNIALANSAILLTRLKI